MAKAFWKKNCIVFVFSVFADDSLLGSGASQKNNTRPGNNSGFLEL